MFVCHVTLYGLDWFSEKKNVTLLSMIVTFAGPVNETLIETFRVTLVPSVGLWIVTGPLETEASTGSRRARKRSTTNTSTLRTTRHLRCPRRESF